jgi:DNA-directed RNA polymerase subunit RPC12/RpoP
MPTADAPTAAPRQFPCQQCGARLEFAPGTDTLVCPYCGFANKVPGAPEVRTHTVPGTRLSRPVVDAADAPPELDYQGTLRTLAGRADQVTAMTVRCGACGAQVTAPPGQAAFPCPFCGSSIVAVAQASTLLKPGAVLPFKVPRDRAIDAFRGWLKSRWFAPSALKSEGRLDASVAGVYLPAWTYDAQTTTRYVGERGDAYYTTETYYVNGRPQTRTVRHVRWTPASGVVDVPFDDVLVLASRTLPVDEVERLEPWDLKSCVKYADEYLAGFRAEVYALGLEEGFGVAREKMQPAIVSAVENDIGGDEQRIHDLKTRYDAVTFKLVMLPVWLSAYRYNNTVYRFLVNARTGEVTGQRPYSPLKITLFVLMCLAIVAIIAVIASHSR